MTQFITELTPSEIDNVSGGPLFIPLAPYLIIAGSAGYLVGSDLAQRDNAREAQQK